MTSDPTSPPQRPPQRYDFEVTIRWPDGRAFVAEGTTVFSLREAAEKLRSLAQTVDAHADRLASDEQR